MIEERTHMTLPINRRTFHKQAAAMGALAALPSTRLMALNSNDRVRLGCIGQRIRMLDPQL